MRSGRAWSCSEWSSAANAPSPFTDGSTSLEQAFGLYEPAFYTAAVASDGSANVFEKQDPSSAQADCASPSSSPPPPPPPVKRSRSDQSHEGQKGDSPEEHSILSQHHNSALCVC